MAHLQPAKHVRGVIPRVCATCAFGEIDSGGFICQRLNAEGYSSFSCDAGSMYQWLMVCDRYKIGPAYNYADVERKALKR